MERPTTLEVDLALMISKLDSPTASNAAKLLALEVRALREELAESAAEFDKPLMQELKRLRATLARVTSEIELAREARFDAVSLFYLEQILGVKP